MSQHQIFTTTLLEPKEFTISTQPDGSSNMVTQAAISLLVTVPSSSLISFMAVGTSVIYKYLLFKYNDDHWYLYVLQHPYPGAILIIMFEEQHQQGDIS